MKSVCLKTFCLFLLTAMLINGCGWIHGNAVKQSKKYNVIIYLVDTVRFDHLGLYGYRRKTSDNLDQFAKQGVIFTNAYTNGGWTKPSVASLLTATYPSAHGAIDKVYDVLAPENVTAAEIFKENGYVTAGLTSNGWVDKRFGFSQGYDTYFHLREYPGLSREKGHVYTCSEFEEPLFKTLESIKSAPFYLYIHTIDPHDPYSPPKEIADEYDPGYKGEVDGSIKLMRYLQAQYFQLSPRDMFHLQALYDGELKYGDDFFGKFIAKLMELGIYKNSIIVFISDHGEEFYEHRNYRHGWEVYEETIRIPLCIRFPVGFSGMKVGTRVEIIDVLPTIIDYLGFEKPDSFQGQSLLPVLKNNKFNQRKYLFCELDVEDHKHYAKTIADGNWKLIWHPNEKRFELYDLKTDPGEKVDLKDKYPDIFNNLRQELEKWIGEQQSFRKKRTISEAQEDEMINDELKALGYIQ